MSSLQNLYLEPEHFSGTVRLFPLPNLVMFPHVLQPLHIFEPRYREMTAAALADDQLIAMGTLQPGWESDYDGRPPVVSIGCLSRVVAHHQVADGRYNLLLAGLKRIALVRELPAQASYREFEARLIEDHYAPDPTRRRSSLRRRLLESFQRLTPHMPDALETVVQMLSDDVPLGTLTDVIGYTLDAPLEFKERLLREIDVDQRARWMIEQIETMACEPAGAGAPGGFPPAFSCN